MSTPAAPRVVLYGRAGCHLCDEARHVVARVCADAGVPWVEVDVDGDAGGLGPAGASPTGTGAIASGATGTGMTGTGPTGTGPTTAGVTTAGATTAGATGAGPAGAGHAAGYGDRVPVVVVDGVEVAQWHVSERALRAALAPGATRPVA